MWPQDLVSLLLLYMLVSSVSLLNIAYRGEPQEEDYHWYKKYDTVL